MEVAPARASLNVYHLGNNHLHRTIYERALREPGIAVIHDAVLNHFLLGALSRERYIEEFVYNYGGWTRDLAAELWRRRARSAADARYFAYPMLRRIAETSRAVIVHNPAAAERVREHAPGAHIEEIPLLWAEEQPADAALVLACRQGLGVGAGDLLCGVFGHLRESKRLHAAIDACERTRTHLLLAGAMGLDLERSLGPRLDSPWIHRTGVTSEREFHTLMSAVDVCINLRYPSSGETSAVGVRMMGLGKPVLFSDAPEIARYPVESCIRIETGLGEQAHLEDVLRWLKQARSDAREIGRRASLHIRAAHSAERVAALYWDVVRRYA